MSHDLSQYVEHCEACGDPTFVGIGTDPIRWLCLTHFHDALAAVREQIRARVNTVR